MSRKNTSPLLSVRRRSVLASRALLLRGEDFGFDAWSATEYARDTDRSCWSAWSGFMQRFRRGGGRGAAQSPGPRGQPPDPAHRHDRRRPADHPRHPQQRRRGLSLPRLSRLRFSHQLGFHPHRQTRRHHARPVHRMAHRRRQPAAMDLRRPPGRQVPRRFRLHCRFGHLQLRPHLRRQIAAIRRARRAHRAGHRLHDRQLRKDRRQDDRHHHEIPVQLPALPADPHPDRQPGAMGGDRQELVRVSPKTPPAPAPSRSPRSCSANTPRCRATRPTGTKRASRNWTR